MNRHLKNSELVRSQIEDLLPAAGPIDFDKLNINVQHLVNVAKDISSGVPLSMSSLVAQYTMANFASQFQYKFLLGSSKIPTNVIGFLLAGSGGGKDSTVNAQERATNPGYVIIEQKRVELAKEAAKRRAEAEDGEDANWSKWYKEPNPLTNSISTVEGLTSRLNKFASAGVGMPSVYVGELGSELASNPNMTDNIRLISELYDSGDKKSKAIKDEERQDAEVKGMGMNALFVGSEDNIIMDKAISQKFKTEFITKLARRTNFVYPSHEEFEECIIEYRDYEDMKTKQQNMEDLAYEGKAYIGSATMDIASRLVDSESRSLDISDECLTAYKDYKMYTTSLGNGTDYIYKSVQLEQLHRSWKALKLASVYAMWDLSETIEYSHFKEAVYFCEKIGHYLESYEQYASKEPYELLLDYFKIHPEHKLSLHSLKKRGFISGTSGLESRIKELVRLSDSLAGSNGQIKFEGDIMSYKPFEMVGEHWASYIEVSGTKQERATMCHSGFTAKTTTFQKLSKLLANDTAYTPFKFADGKRKNDNIISGATWVALDVDDSDVTLNEMHDILDGINHHIASTSNSENPYKFRVILEFNTIADLPVREWKQFGKALGKELGIDIDPATFTKSQIMFGYKGATILSCTDGDPYDISECIKLASVITANGRTAIPGRAQGRILLDKPLETFAFAFKENQTNRSLSMFRMWKWAMELGATEQECETLMNDLNYNFWESPIEDNRFDGYIRQMQLAFNERENK